MEKNAKGGQNPKPRRKGYFRKRNCGGRARKTMETTASRTWGKAVAPSRGMGGENSQEPREADRPGKV